MVHTLTGKQILVGDKVALYVEQGIVFSPTEFNILKDGDELMRGVVHVGALCGDNQVRSLQSHAMKLIVADMYRCGWLKTSSITITAQLPRESVNNDVGVTHWGRTVCSRNDT